MNKKVLNRLFSAIASLSLLVNSISAPLSIYAQEITPEPTPVVEETPTPTPEATPTPTEETIPTPTSEITPTPTEELIPTPTEELIATPPAEPQTESQPSQENSQPSVAEPSPTVTPQVVEEEKGELSAVILDNVNASSIDEFDFEYQTEGSATLITDKLDYAPTDTVLITGTGFTPNETYDLLITSETGNFRFSDRVSSDESGNLFYSYQLDGTYRPDYRVEVKDGDFVVASTTFTDAEVGFNSPSATGNPNEWSNGNRAYTSNDSYANTNDDNDDQGYRNFGFSIPSSSTINGIEVKLEAKQEGTTCELQSRLSWNNGSDDTDRKTVVPTGSDSIFTLGGASDTWGHTWSAGGFSNSNFVLEVRYNDPGNNCGDSDDIYLDHVQVKVYYTPFVNTPPTITEGATTSVTMSKNSTPTAFSLTLHASDLDAGQALTWSISSGASHGTATASGGTGTSKSIGYTPTSNYVGSDSFVVQVSDGHGGTDTITVNVTIQETNVPNPTLPNSCGLDIALVFDGSGSIDGGEYGNMQSAFVSFVNAFLPGTPTEMSIVEFASGSILRQGFTNNTTTLTNEINESRVQPGGQYTNWKDGLITAHNLFTYRSNPDLIVFASDGNPNRPVESTALADAISEANSIKSDGIRIITIGIGNDLDANNLKAISSADAYYASNFENLAETLAGIASDLCGGTITVTKLIDADGNIETTGDQTPTSGWEFNVGGTPKTTGSNGQTDPVTLTDGTYSVIETPQTGYNLIGASCIRAVNNGNRDGNGIYGIQINNTSIVSCTFINTLIPVNLGLTLAKTNDKTGGATAGDTVNYTLTVTNTGNLTVDNVIVKDTLPGGFIYVLGSTKIDSIPAADPVESAGVLTWLIPSVSTAEPVVIEYQAKIASDLIAGTYTNYATCQNVQIPDGEFILYRGFFIQVECNGGDPASSQVTINQIISYGGQLPPQVLGAATELPATGSSSDILTFAFIIGALGIVSKIRAGKTGEKKHAKN